MYNWSGELCKENPIFKTYGIFYVKKVRISLQIFNVQVCIEKLFYETHPRNSR